MRRVTKHLIFAKPAGGFTALDVSFDSQDATAADIGMGALINLEELIFEEARRKGCTLQHSHVSRRQLETPGEN